ncbi:LacI family DNA-binding transcriptional regulator [Tessaracoccus flavus]|uniref:LacI family DNA-binding transcriptional regulator n=1 Tax=Tessaracoccus flavus TaxID=1610493 RepID=UPI00139036CE|nr:LacI family DNA-binding transcriptional regulator [Tessaracoccus flavus]
MTRDDVARLAGVSVAVVSYVVNNGPRPVAEATRARVLDAIDRLGYRPNAAARSLTTGRSDLVGLIVPDVGNPYFAALAQAVETEARARGVNLVLVQGRAGQLAPLVESLSGHLVAGIITAAVPEAAAEEILRRDGIAMVRLSLAPSETGDGAVLPDFYSGALDATRHLIEVHGHRRVALVLGGEGPVGGLTDDRFRGWRDALAAAGLPTDAVIRAPWSLAGGRDAATRLVTDFPDCTAVFAGSDQQAIGLISGLHGLGRSIPADMAIASFDGSPEAKFTVPPLTTAGVPMAVLARAAVEGLFAPGRPAEAFRPDLVLRSSCGCL